MSGVVFAVFPIVRLHMASFWGSAAVHISKAENLLAPETFNFINRMFLSLLYSLSSHNEW